MATIRWPEPPLLYGTAWKEEDTERLVTLAIESGFRGIDTANQRKHYDEAAVGAALAAAVKRGLCTREQLFVQTKFTFVGGQDHRLPYDAKAPVATQVAQSCASSLEHLRVSVIDSYVLHGPMARVGWSAADAEAWRAMEALHEQGLVRALGVSNVSLEQLQSLCAGARVQPTFVQNRCYASRGWDAEVRAFCVSKGMVYQGFSLLTANPEVVESAAVRALARRLVKSAEQVVLRLAVELGMLPLTGTTDVAHMRDDLEVNGFSLSAADVKTLAQTP